MFRKLCGILLLCGLCQFAIGKTIQLYNRLELVLPQAEQGDRNAQFNVGVIYNRGWNTPVDNVKALYWFKKAALQGHTSSLYNVGVFYLEGEGTVTNPAEAVKWLEQAGEQGHHNAQAVLSDMFLFGDGVPKDLLRGFYWREKIIAKGSVAEQLQFAKQVLSFREIDHTLGLFWLKKLAEQQYPDAQIALIAYLGEKYDTSQDPLVKQKLLPEVNHALNLLYPLAEKGNAEAQYLYAYRYSSNMPEGNNSAEQCRWIRKAAVQALTEAEYSLGLCYLNGWNGEKSESKAFQWFLKAAEKGHMKAQVDVARAYLMGKGVEKNQQKATTFLEKAAKAGDADAQFMLGTALFHQTSHKPEGIELLKKSAEQGNLDGQFNLALHYHKNKQPKQALYWFEKAALGGDVLAFAKLVQLYPKKTRIKKLHQIANQAPASIAFALGKMYNTKRFGKVDKVQMLKWYQLAVDKGSKEAQFQLGLHYFFGETVEQDVEKAIALFEQFAEQSDGDIKAEMAMRFHLGKDFPKDDKKARYWLEQAVKWGHVGAEYWLGLFNMRGIGGEKNLEQANYWLNKALEDGEERAEIYLALLHQQQGIRLSKYANIDWQKWAEKGHPTAQIELALALHAQGNFKQAFEWWKKAAEQGDETAQSNLAVYYMRGWAGEENEQKARYWFEKAAEQQEKNAQFSLGVIYLYGLGVESDPIAAEKWLKLAAAQDFTKARMELLGLYESQARFNENIKIVTEWAEQGDTTAQLMLAQHYYPDPKTSFYWLKRAAEQQEPHATLWLGVFYAKGIGVETDVAKGIEILTTIAEQGDPLAQYQLGQILWEARSTVQAINWFERSANTGLPEAQFALGKLYFLGEHLPKSYGKAFHWFSLAAENQHPDAMFLLSAFYFNGYGGLPKDEEKGRMWLKDAANLSQPQALFMLGLVSLEKDDFQQAVGLFEKSAKKFDLAQQVLVELKQHLQNARTSQQSFELEQPNRLDRLELDDQPLQLNEKIKRPREESEELNE
ncbi:hypothetical protein A1D29_10205 [Pasteurellaceae bacterium Orientalotternb1]|nr:hypothetical protein A1D29_10205 [Pasteurellaceae bacterium Orientalotternb1]